MRHASVAPEADEPIAERCDVRCDLGRAGGLADGVDAQLATVAGTPRDIGIVDGRQPAAAPSWASTGAAVLVRRLAVVVVVDVAYVAGAPPGVTSELCGGVGRG